ncbi:MAG: hypothetical protein JNL84_05350 [Candidatus Accumulibacter sp.]|nr:hypothetical protein [Accumulibacter sp.]
MEKWISRGVATLVALGGLGLFWTFGVFIAVPWRENRLLALSSTETQVVAVSLIAGLAVIWGAQHLLAIADAKDHPRLFQGLRIALLLACLLAVFKGSAWTMAKLG